MSGKYPEPGFRGVGARVLYRFLLGRPLDGARRTDATFWRHARASMDPSGYASWWSRLPGWQRLGWRLVVLYVLAWVPPVLIGWVPWTVAVSRHAGVLVTVLGPVLAYQAVRYFGLKVPVPVLAWSRRGPRFEGWVSWTLEGRRGWERTKVRPVAMAATGVLGTHYRSRTARRWVHVPRSYRDQDGRPVSIALPPKFVPDKGTQDRLARAVAARLGMRDPDVRWDLEGEKPKMFLSAPPIPPTELVFADVRELFERTEEFKPLLGLAARRAPLYGHMVNDSPHIAVSAGPGAGKSELIKNIGMQALHWGWGLIMCDWKEVSHDWCRGLPGVLYVVDVEKIHDLWVRLGEEVDIRKRAYREDRTMPGRSKVMIVCEEMNITADLLNAYWENLRSTADPEEKRTMPAKSPAMAGLRAVNFAGRQLGMFLVFVAQRFSAKVTNGNADLRESFQIRLMARYSPQTVKMLAGDIKPFPKKPDNLGQWVAVMGSEAVVFKSPLTTDEEAREFAMAGLPNPPTPLSGSHMVDPSQRHSVAPTQGDQLRPVTASPLAMTDARKLVDMVDALEPLGITLPILRKAAREDGQGDPDFPKVHGGHPNKGYTYDFDAVREWARRRRARVQAEKRST